MSRDSGGAGTRFEVVDMVDAKQLQPTAGVVALDVSDAPPRDRDAMTAIWRILHALFLGTMLAFPVGFLDLPLQSAFDYKTRIFRPDSTASFRL